MPYISDWLRLCPEGHGFFYTQKQVKETAAELRISQQECSGILESNTDGNTEFYYGKKERRSETAIRL